MGGAHGKPPIALDMSESYSTFLNTDFGWPQTGQ